MTKWLPADKLYEILERLPPDAEVCVCVCVNHVGNLSVQSGGRYVGYIDFLSGEYEENE